MALSKTQQAIRSARQVEHRNNGNVEGIDLGFEMPNHSGISNHPEFLNFFRGIIVMWSGSIATIPSGWVLCDGSNGTPDLRNVFIVGAQEDEGGTAKTDLEGMLQQSGGSETHTHTVSASGTTGQGVNVSEGIEAGASGSDFYVSGETHTHTVTVTGTTGQGSSLPPFFSLAFIMKT